MKITCWKCEALVYELNKYCITAHATVFECSVFQYDNTPITTAVSCPKVESDDLLVRAVLLGVTAGKATKSVK